MERSNPLPASGDPEDNQSQESDIEIARGPSGSSEASRKQMAERWQSSRGGKALEPSAKQMPERRRRIMTRIGTNLDDGYSWRKYGQKEIFGSKHPRGYYRCTNRNTMGCHALKQVQRSDVDPTMFEITYLGDHTCHHIQKKQELQISPNIAQQLSDLQSTAVSDFGDSTSRDHSEIIAASSEQSGNHKQSPTHEVSGSTSAAMSVEFTSPVNDMMMDKETVVSLLLQSDYGGEHNVSVVSIVGAEGAGKTTLARFVYDDPLVCEAFELRSWICLTRVNNAKDLLSAMIKSLTTLSCHPFEQLSELQEIVKEEVTSRKYLLVLDNLWDTRILGTQLLTPLMFGGEGSKILVTTKEVLVVDTTLWMKEFDKCNMSEDVCWQIMKECAFGVKDSSAYPDLTEVGQMMVPLCGGNPLAARAIGGLLHAKVYDPSTTKFDVLDNELWKPNKNEDNIYQALRLSYNFLPDFLKKCLIYCSLFPKGYVFEEHYLVRLWMAQGYVEPLDYKEKEETTREYLNELLGRSFLQRSRNLSFPGDCYEMHDLIYDLLQTISRMEAFQGEYNKKAHVVSFLSDRSSEDFEALKESPNLQSLLVDRHLLEYSGRNKIQIMSSKILSDLLGNLMHINALDLSFSNIIELPDSIGKLKSLRYLGLNSTNIRKLPASLCNLYNLQALELRNCVYMQTLPEEINRLSNLRHLDTQKRSGFIGIPQGLSQLTRLRTLSAFSVTEENEWHAGISELNNLVNIRGDLWIGGLRHVINENEAEEANLNNKEGLESLTLQWSTSGGELDEMDGKANKMFEYLKPHGNLKQLVVRDYSGDQFPGWIGNPSFSKLISITLDNCRWCKRLPPLGRLTSLKHLFIRRMDSVKSMGREFLDYKEKSSLGAFASLETLKIWEMYNLEEWHGVKGKDFPCLRSVSISRCFKLWSLPCLPTLLELTIHGGAEVPILSYLPSLTSLSIDCFHSLKTLILQPGLTSILKLEVKDCSQLSSLLGLRYSKTLREIKLDKCPILDLELDELPLALEFVNINQTCSLLSTWCPSGFYKSATNFGQAIRRRLVREKQQGWPNLESENMEVQEPPSQQMDTSLMD